MAWVVRKSIKVEDSPMCHWTPDTVKEILQSNAAVVSQYSALSPDDSKFIKEGDAPAGLPVPESNIPYEVVIDKMVGSLPDIPKETVVNDRVKSMIEAIEQGVHQFFATILILPDGSRDEGWWNMRACHRLDAIAFEQCERVQQYFPRPDEHPTWYRYRSHEDSLTKIAVQKSVVAGKAIWWDWRFNRFFISDELGQRFIDEGVRGLALPTDALNISSHVIEV